MRTVTRVSLALALAVLALAAGASPPVRKPRTNPTTSSS